MDLDKLEQLFAKLGGSVRGLNGHINALNKAMNALPESSENAAESIMNAASKKFEEISKMEQELSKQQDIIFESTYQKRSRDKYLGRIKRGEPARKSDLVEFAESTLKKNQPTIKAAEAKAKKIKEDITNFLIAERQTLEVAAAIAKKENADKKRLFDREKKAREELIGEIKTVATRYKLIEKEGKRNEKGDMIFSPIGYRKLLDPQAAALLDEGMALTSRKEREGSAFKLSKEQQELINVTKLYTDELRKQEKAMSAGYDVVQKAEKDKINLMHKDALQMNKEIDGRKRLYADLFDEIKERTELEKEQARVQRENIRKE